MSRYIAVLALALLTGCHERSGLVPVSKCGQECYTLDAGRWGAPGVGACQMGRWDCTNDDESTAVCDGQTGPTEEVCDNIDNDCDGFVDTNLYQDCTNACGYGSAHCERGVWEHCTAPTPKPEVCNGADDDCDGLIDNNLPVEVCFDAGVPANLQYGPCRPGVVHCISGQSICSNQIGPTAEVCNGIDDNCNGSVDEGLGGTADVVLIADCVDEDFSDELHVFSLIQGLATQFGPDQRYKFAVICSTSPDGGSGVTVFKNFTDIQTLAASSNTITGAMGTDDTEATLDAIAEVADYSHNPLGLHWTPGSSRFVVLYTDECAASFTTPPTQLADVQALVDQDHLHVYVYVDSTCWSSYGTVTDQDGGFGDQSDLPTDIETRLAAALMGVCK